LEQPGPHTKLSDEELLHAYKSSNNNEWLGYLLQRYTMLLFGVAMKYLKDKEQAHDAVQQVFLKVLSNMHGEEFRNFKGWLYVLMRNHCLQLLRDQHYRAGDEALVNVPETEGPDKEEIAWQEYSLEQMKQALEELNSEQRTSIVLFYLEKKSYQQIMEQTGYSFVQVKSYIQNGKRNLKLILLKKLANRV
jgi:RNA polymerase sigma factor (sigma-70 family)